ncbi:MAG: type II toxin-antitoxin system VapB family antitoxin [Acidobacteriaceae bacterium]
MATNLALDDNLIEEARKLGGHKSKKAAVTAALDEYILRRKQKDVIRLFGTIEYDPAYDYKAERKARRA